MKNNNKWSPEELADIVVGVLTFVIIIQVIILLIYIVAPLFGGILIKKAIVIYGGALLISYIVRKYFQNKYLKGDNVA
jgi:uncharacterized protein (DUF697 family)